MNPEAVESSESQVLTPEETWSTVETTAEALFADHLQNIDTETTQVRGPVLFERIHVHIEGDLHVTVVRTRIPNYPPMPGYMVEIYQTGFRRMEGNIVRYMFFVGSGTHEFKTEDMHGVVKPARLTRSLCARLSPTITTFSGKAIESIAENKKRARGGRRRQEPEDESPEY
jgi:hypothetical protein